MILKSQVYLQTTGCDMWCICLCVDAEFNLKKREKITYKTYLKSVLVLYCALGSRIASRVSQISPWAQVLV